MTTRQKGRDPPSEVVCVGGNPTRNKSKNNFTNSIIDFPSRSNGERFHPSSNGGPHDIWPPPYPNDNRSSPPIDNRYSPPIDSRFYSPNDINKFSPTNGEYRYSPPNSGNGSDMIPLKFVEEPAEPDIRQGNTLGGLQSHWMCVQTNAANPLTKQPVIPRQIIYDGSGGKSQQMVVYRQFGSSPRELMTLETEAGIPEPMSPSDVVIKVQASTVSRSDCIIRSGINVQPMDPVCLPVTPGMDVVGNVIKVGLGVKNVQLGDRIAALVRSGGNARYAIVSSKALVAVPRSLDSAEAACMVSTYMTAFQSIRMASKNDGSLQGKRILVTGGIDAVAQALIQLCTRAGASKVYTTAPEPKHKYIRTVLRASPLVMDTDQWLPQLRGQMDVIFDTLCEDQSIQNALKHQGVVVNVGMSALLGHGDQVGVLGAEVASFWTKLKGHFLSNMKTYEVWESFQAYPETFKRELEYMLDMLRKRIIKPHIAKRVTLSEVPDAHVYLEKGRARGEIVCLPWKRQDPPQPSNRIARRGDIISGSPRNHKSERLLEIFPTLKREHNQGRSAGHGREKRDP